MFRIYLAAKRLKSLIFPASVPHSSSLSAASPSSESQKQNRSQFPQLVAVPGAGRLVEDVSYYFSLINRLSAECRWLPLPQYVIPLQCDSDTCHWKNVNMKCIYVCRIVKLNTRTRMCSSRPPRLKLHNKLLPGAWFSWNHLHVVFKCQVEIDVKSLLRISADWNWLNLKNTFKTLALRCYAGNQIVKSHS